ncbi:hypothetical protein F5148DRAFT_1370826 [Russula earlei]|uniref:Uncharacterized protein n=1 Tax=Russula earlei TaxID=71964 RepID=A0ACC0TW13_9AGAM|nr:hypothetical protein F5148DRAFT_1370826 [Russula earlei]
MLLLCPCPSYERKQNALSSSTLHLVWRATVEKFFARRIRIWLAHPQLLTTDAEITPARHYLPFTILAFFVSLMTKSGSHLFREVLSMSPISSDRIPKVIAIKFPNPIDVQGRPQSHTDTPETPMTSGYGKSRWIARRGEHFAREIGSRYGTDFPCENGETPPAGLLLLVLLELLLDRGVARAAVENQCWLDEHGMGMARVRRVRDALLLLCSSPSAGDSFGHAPMRIDPRYCIVSRTRTERTFVGAISNNIRSIVFHKHKHVQLKRRRQ